MSSSIDKEDDLQYQVLVNAEEQYSLWRADHAIPPGWKNAGMRGTKAECLVFIREVWTDMRPKSLRQSG